MYLFHAKHISNVNAMRLTNEMINLAVRLIIFKLISLFRPQIIRFREIDLFDDVIVVIGELVIDIILTRGKMLKRRCEPTILTRVVAVFLAIIGFRDVGGTAFGANQSHV